MQVSGNNVWLVCFNCREQFIPVCSKMCLFPSVATVTSEFSHARWHVCRVWHLKAVNTLTSWGRNVSFCSIYKLKSEWSFRAKTDKSYCRIEFSVPHHNTLCASLRSSHCFKRISFLIKYLQRSFFLFFFFYTQCSMVITLCFEGQHQHYQFFHG